MSEAVINIEEVMEEIRKRAKEIEYTAPVTFDEIPVPVIREEKKGFWARLRGAVKSLAYKVFGQDTVHRIRREFVKRNSGR